MAVGTWDLKSWLTTECNSFVFRPMGIYLEESATSAWPFTAATPVDLTSQLRDHGHLAPLPTESAALANVLEVSLADALTERVPHAPVALTVRRGSDRGYPDLEFSGTGLSDRYWAVDIKVAMRAKMKSSKKPTKTQSRITLYTGNTYFQNPKLHWPGTIRPFGDYSGHLDLLVLYTFHDDRPERVSDLQIVVHEPWRIASHQRASTTREYIGAVSGLEDLVNGTGEFDTEEEFYRFWRAYEFKISKGVHKTLRRLTGQ